MSTVPGPNVLASNVPQVPLQDCGSVCVCGWTCYVAFSPSSGGGLVMTAPPIFFDFFFDFFLNPNIGYIYNLAQLGANH